MSDENVNRSIRELRLRLGMTQEEFAHAVAVTFSTVNRWENGHAKPSKLARRAIEALARRGAPRREGAGGSDRIGDGSERLAADAGMIIESHQ
jgi:transcriptional regulator with XRE-family HTH domain